MAAMRPLSAGIWMGAVAFVFGAVNLPPLARDTDPLRDVLFPLTTITLIPAVADALLNWGLNKSRRRAAAWAAGRCAECGYELRATPDVSGALQPRCLECGAGSFGRPHQRSRW